MNFIVGKKYRMRNEELAEYLGYDLYDGFSLIFRATKIIHIRDDGRYSDYLLAPYDIISDVPVEESSFVSDALKYAEEATKGFTKDVVNHLDKLETKIEAELVIEAGMYDPKLGGVIRKEIYRGPLELKGGFSEEYKEKTQTRRQFDVSKLNEPQQKDAPQMAIYYLQKLVLETWNEGKIEELLQSWTTPESKESVK